MAFLRYENICNSSESFVEKIDLGKYKKDRLINHSTKFHGAHEDLTLADFSQFVSSASYALIRLRRGQHMGDEYHGC